MKNTFGLMSLLCLTALASACGGGGGGGGGDGGGGATPTPTTSPSPTPTPGPVTDDDARRLVLADLGNDVILPTLRQLDTRADALSAAVTALAAAPENADARTTAQTEWREAMTLVQRAEVFQIGPGARSSEAGGQDLRDLMYAFPLLSQCGIHQAAYANTPVTETTPINETGMGALEYLLFSDNDNPACPPGDGVDGQARRAAHAGRIATRVAAVTEQLRTAWEPTGGNFVQTFATAGPGNMTYDMPQDALDAISVGLFYTEKETKDRKVANAIGLGVTGLPPCGTVSCPERVESPFAMASGQHIRDNLQAFRDLFTGLDGGMGLNDLLQGIGRSDIASKLITQADAALAAADLLTDRFEAEVAAIPSREACINASSARMGAPAACALHGLIGAMTDTYRAEVTSALNLRIPAAAAGDND